MTNPENLPSYLTDLHAPQSRQQDINPTTMTGAGVIDSDIDAGLLFKVEIGNGGPGSVEVSADDLRPFESSVNEDGRVMDAVAIISAGNGTRFAVIDAGPSEGVQPEDDNDRYKLANINGAKDDPQVDWGALVRIMSPVQQGIFIGKTMHNGLHSGDEGMSKDHANIRFDTEGNMIVTDTSTNGTGVEYAKRPTGETAESDKVEATAAEAIAEVTGKTALRTSVNVKELPEGNYVSLGPVESNSGSVSIGEVAEGAEFSDDNVAKREEALINLESIPPNGTGSRLRDYFDLEAKLNKDPNVNSSYTKQEIADMSQRLTDLKNGMNNATRSIMSEYGRMYYGS